MWLDQVSLVANLRFRWLIPGDVITCAMFDRFSKGHPANCWVKLQKTSADVDVPENEVYPLGPQVNAINQWIFRFLPPFFIETHPSYCWAYIRLIPILSP
jgi:hypothetical protein